MDEEIKEQEKELGIDSPIAEEPTEETPEVPTEVLEMSGAVEPTPAETATAGPTAGEGEPLSEPIEPTEKMLAQSQVNELVGKARQEGFAKGREACLKETFEKYGVGASEDLDKLFMDGSRYGEQSSRMAELESKLHEAEAKLALMQAGIPEAKWDDVKAILAYNGQPITLEAIQSLLPSHPEWKGEAQTAIQAPTPQPQPIPQEPQMPQKIGATPTLPTPSPKNAEEERASVMKDMGF